MKCPANSQPCECQPSSIRHRECSALAIKTGERIDARPVHGSVQRAALNRAAGAKQQMRLRTALRAIPPLLALLAMILVLPTAARADMQLGLQDDEAMKYQTADYLARADYAGATWIRLMAQDNRWNAGEADAIVNAAVQAHAHGKHVMVSLLAWRSHPTAGEWRTFAEQVVSRMAPYVDVWSPMNEPSWPGMSPYTGTQCLEVGSPSGVTTRAQRRWKRVRRGKGRYNRHVKVRNGRKVVRYTKARTRRQRHRARWVRLRRAPLKTVYVTSREQHQECSTEAFATAYRRVWDHVAPVLAQDTGAKLVVGDVCGGGCGDPIEFMEAFYANGQPAVQPDIFGVHYDDPSEARDHLAYARSRGLAFWLTEWALLPGVRASEWAERLNRFEAIGVGATMIYDTNVPSWDTQLRPADLEAVAGR